MGVFEDVRELIVEQMSYGKLKPEDIKLESKLYEDLNFDSLDAVELTMDIETKFSLEISDEDAEKCKTVGDVVTYVRERT